MLVGTSLYLARSWYFMKFGMAMAARMPMIATTIMSSTSVKPLAIVFFIASSGGPATVAGWGLPAR